VSRARRLLALLPALLLLQCASSGADLPVRASLVLEPCRLPGLAEPARCGALDVAENPERPDGRRLAIRIAVLPATGGRALADPIVPLLGGPGEDAISGAADFAGLFAALRAERDVLLVDQRGTGGSNPLRCALYSSGDPGASLRDLFPPAAVAACAQALAARADLTQYGYARFASDLEQVRRALGYGPLNLWAGSYGTRAAQVFARAYPASTRTLYLGSPVPIDFAMPLPFARAAEAALQGMLEACAADAACRAAFPDLRAELAAITAQLESGSVRVSVPGSPDPALLSRGRVAEWFRAMLYRPSSAAVLPLAIHRAHAGDWSPIAEGILAHARGVDNALSLGLLFAITCSEDVAFVREADVAAATQGTFLGDYRLRQQQAACAHWPRFAVPDAYRTPVRSPAPTLFVSGDSDAATPVAFAQHLAPGFAARVEVVLANRGHTEQDPCLDRLYADLVRSGSAAGLDGSCPARARPPFRTR
jgi:pimeloyl-ACP methyl ester carboxylesterase